MAMGIAWGIIRGMLYLLTPVELVATDIIFHLSFMRFDINVFEIGRVFSEIFHYVIFYAIFGLFIYRKFAYSSIYYFSRCPTRKRWFFRQALALIILSFQFIITTLAMVVLITSIFKDVSINQMFLILSVHFVLLHGLWIFNFALLVNIFSIVYDSRVGFVIVAALQVLTFSGLLLWDGVLKMEQISLYLNPFTHLIFNWKELNFANIYIPHQHLEYSIPLVQSYILFALITFCVLFFGCVTISRKEIISYDTETGGL
jgi:hypothetical protein